MPLSYELAHEESTCLFSNLVKLSLMTPLLPLVMLRCVFIPSFRRKVIANDVP